MMPGQGSPHVLSQLFGETPKKVFDIHGWPRYQTWKHRGHKMDVPTLEDSKRSPKTSGFDIPISFYMEPGRFF
jgi:hypothetical protein